MHPQHIQNYSNPFLISTIVQGFLTIEIARRSDNITGAWLLHGINRLFIIAIFLCAIVVGAFVLFMEYYGNALLEKHLSDMFGTKVNFKSVTLNVKRNCIIFSDFSIYNEIGPDS